MKAAQSSYCAGPEGLRLPDNARLIRPTPAPEGRFVIWVQVVPPSVVMYTPLAALPVASPTAAYSTRSSLGSMTRSENMSILEPGIWVAVVFTQLWPPSDECQMPSLPTTPFLAVEIAT